MHRSLRRWFSHRRLRPRTNRRCPEYSRRRSPGSPRSRACLWTPRGADRPQARRWSWMWGTRWVGYPRTCRRRHRSRSWEPEVSAVCWRCRPHAAGCQHHRPPSVYSAARESSDPCRYRNGCHHSSSDRPSHTCPTYLLKDSVVIPLTNPSNTASQCPWNVHSKTSFPGTESGNEPRYRLTRSRFVTVQAAIRLIRGNLREPLQA